MCARTAILGALLNVRINLTSIKDEKFVKEMSEEADMIEQTTMRHYMQTKNIFINLSEKPSGLYE